MATKTQTQLSTAFMSTTLVAPFEKSCPTCGQAPESEMEEHTASHHSRSDSRRRVRDLEGQVKSLNGQTAQMSEKLIEYEAEMRRLRSQSATQPHLSSLTPRNSTSTATSTPTYIPQDPQGSLSRSGSQTQTPPPPQAQPQPQPQGRFSSLASLLPYRRPSTASHLQQQPQQPQTLQSPAQIDPPRTPTPRPSSDSTSHSTSSDSASQTLELQNALNREQSLRKAAETQLTQASSELEELTAQLFSQANEMVAQERKARARLEERVAVLERRDVEKRGRLERLEKAMARVERIRALVG